VCSSDLRWSERKRGINLGEHGLDFVDAPRVFEGLTFTFGDDRFPYGEQRFVTLGLLAGIPVSTVVLGFAPGGLAEMSLVAIALGADAAFVATHHLVRIVLVVICAAPLFRIFDPPR
jgi:uncharacterized DUF497 family protein